MDIGNVLTGHWQRLDWTLATPWLDQGKNIKK